MRDYEKKFTRVEERLGRETALKESVKRDPSTLVSAIFPIIGWAIRSGIFQEKVFLEAFPFSLYLRLLRNPNMAANGRCRRLQI